MTISGTSNISFNETIIGSGASRVITVNNSALATISTIQIAELNELTPRAVTIAGSGNVVINEITDLTSTQGSLIVSGAGLSLTLAGNNTYESLTSIRDGSVYFAQPGVFGIDNSVITVATTTGDVNPRVLTTGLPQRRYRIPPIGKCK